ncbi:MAG: hypothetical protein LBH51_00125 [Treponema sp.]|jgi:hypothetical protein|nr:hypothetical protein [Treponema sp.]
MNRTRFPPNDYAASFPSIKRPSKTSFTKQRLFFSQFTPVFRLLEAPAYFFPITGGPRFLWNKGYPLLMLPEKRAAVFRGGSFMKRTYLFGGVLSILLFAFALAAAGCSDGGNTDPPVVIKTAAELDAIRNNLNGNYILDADIDLSSYTNFNPIGVFTPISDAPEDSETPKLELAFTGVFDGNGHKISNLAISAPTQAGVGLFGCVAGVNGVVKNLVVENATVTGYMLVSGVIGYGEIKNTIENITLQGANTITGTNMVGGIVGGGFCDIKNSSAAADIILTGKEGIGVGGILAGGMEDSSIIACTVTGGSITAPDGSMAIGGLAGCVEGPEIRDCVVGNVAITVGEECFMVGGLLGFAGTYSPDPPGFIDNCRVINVAISAAPSAERIGGIVGSGFYSSMYAVMASMPGYEDLAAPSAFKIANSSTSGSITGGCTDLVGKIAGYIYDNSTVEISSTSMMTGAADNVGGDKESADLTTLK